MNPDGTLVIRSTAQKDAGVYACLASNAAGTDSKAALLTYIGKKNNWETGFI